MQTTLGDVLEVIRGVTYTSAQVRDDSAPGYLPVLRATNIQQTLTFENLVYVPQQNVSEAQKLRLGDIVIAASSGSKSVVGKAAPLLSQWEGSFGAFCFGLRPSPEISASYIARFLETREYRRRVSELASGSNINNLRARHVTEAPFRLAPRPEQERIVAKLDALLSRVAAGEAAARRALERLKRYRAAVLNAAVTGELTRDWRKTHKPEETGAQLLKRLLVERRARWEEAELKRLQATGKPPRDDKWKGRYEEPISAKTSGLPELPGGWTWASLGQLLFLLRNGIGVSPNEDSGLPVLRISAVRPMFVDLNERRFFPLSTAEQYADFALNEGDLLFTRYNGSKDLAGVCGRVPALAETLVHPDKLIRCVIVPGFAPLDRFVEVAANCGVSRRAIADNLRTTAGQWGISGSALKETPIPFPPADEQKAIVVEVERRLAAADRLSTKLTRQLERARSTRQSLLREAFAGRLVPQDPRDEPASELLKRIHAAFEAEGKKPHAQKKNLTTPRAKRPPTKPKRPPSDRAIVPPKVVVPVTVHTLSPSPLQVRLIRLKLYDDFNSLKAAEFPLRGMVGRPERLSPLCLVGLNGSGKSNLIEALSEIFCHVELSLLPWKSITTKQREIRLRFDLEYQLVASPEAKPTTVRLEKSGGGPVVFKVVGDDSEKVISDFEQCRALLPTRVLGYSSGLNETISIPYFRTAAVYSQEVLKQARREKANPDKKLPDVPDSNTFFMDYECNALILVSNYLLQPRPRLGLFRRNLRIDSIHAFDIRYHGKYRGKKTVELTRELTDYLDALRSCANSVERAGDTEVFRFNNPKAAAPRLRVAFKTAGGFFRALYKLSLLNPLALTGKKRKFHLRDDAKAGLLERPPTISREDRIFSVESIRLNLTSPKRPIDYAAISDGEHQFLQVFGGVTLFDEPGCVFLLDEPETHFNPHWRRLCIQWLADMDMTQRQELMISTHSPFVVSGCHKKHVLKFVRDGGHSVCSSVGDETFGASYDYLLARLFSMETMIAGEAIEEMRELVKSKSIDELRQAIPRFGESLEKRFIFERLAQLEHGKRKRK